MIKKDNSELTAFRRQIDELDDKLIALLVERTGIVRRVGEWKGRNAPEGQCPLRPGREAEMVRRIAEKFQDTSVPPAAAAAIWRLIIGMSTSIEAPLGLSVFTPERDQDLYWMAREYFGSFLNVIRQPHIKRVLGDILDGKAAVGVVPMLRRADTTYWWINLMEPGKDMPKIFARLPFVHNGPEEKNAPSALAIARIEPEDSGDDISVLVLEAEHNVSQHRLQTAFATARFDVHWVNIAALNPQTRYHLIEVKGFITPEHPELKTLMSALGSSITKISFLGAYAVPIELTPTQVETPHAKEPAET